MNQRSPIKIRTMRQDSPLHFALHANTIRWMFHAANPGLFLALSLAPPIFSQRTHCLLPRAGSSTVKGLKSTRARPGFQPGLREARSGAVGAMADTR